VNGLGSRRAPRLSPLRASFPDIELHITSLQGHLQAPSERAADPEVRSGPGDWPGMRVERLSRERIAPVAD